MKIVVAGASGLIGKPLVMALRNDGHEVVRLVRRTVRSPDEVAWNPATHELNPAALQRAGVIVTLAGENIAAGRWTRRRREQILRSRVDAAHLLARAAAQLDPPARLVSASAVGCYGDRGEEVLDESSTLGAGFLADVCRAWEKAGQPIGDGPGTTVLRFGTVLSADGGALARLLPSFRVGLGARLGDGQQWMSWIHLADAVRVIQRVVVDASFVGVCNVVAPAPIRNVEFTRTLGKILHRIIPLSVPRWALRWAFGQMADEALLASTRAVPVRLLTEGFEFSFGDLRAALSDLV